MHEKVRYVLYSFYYILTMKRSVFIQRMQEEHPEVQWFLDSGAFTYWAKFRSEPDKLMNYERYKKLYYQYVQDGWRRWNRVAELDLDMMPGVTLYTLEAWRDEMWNMGVENFTPVWHKNRGPDEWEYYVRDRRWKYLAIGSSEGTSAGVTGYGEQTNDFTFNQHVIGQHKRMILNAHLWGKMVHGFGMTRVNTRLPWLPYDSVDSTSWVNAQKFGTIFVFRDNKFSIIGMGGSMGKDKRKLYRNYFKALGLDWKKIEDDDIAECRRANIIAWRNLSNRLEEMRKRQGRTLYGTEAEIEGWEDRLNPNLRWDPPAERPDGSPFRPRAEFRMTEPRPLALEREGEQKYVEAKERGPGDFNLQQPKERARARPYVRGEEDSGAGRS